MFVRWHDRFLGGYVRVTLDGVDVSHLCRRAHEERGIVEVFSFPMDRWTPDDTDEFGEPKTVIKRGVVEISLRDDAPPSVVRHYETRRGHRRMAIGPKI